MDISSWVKVVSLALVIAGGSATSAAAQNDGSANAADAEAAFHAAKDAAERGDIITAIAALERVLQDNPGLANIRLELGLLYLRAGNPDLARSYLEQAIAAPDAPAEAKARARQALKTATGATDRFSVSGSLFTSASYQSNPNGSPDTISVVGPGGTPIILPGSAISVPRGGDVSQAIGTNLEVRLGLGGQLGNDLVAEGSASLARYGDTEILNSDYIGGTLGPRFYLGPAGAATGFVRPFVLGNYLRLGGAEYFSSYGAGLLAVQQIDLASLLSARLGWEDRAYNNSAIRPTAAEQSGEYWTGTVSYSRLLSPTTRLSLSATGEKTDARTRYWSYDAYGGALQLLHVFPAAGKFGPVSADLGFAYRRADYDGPDPLIDPTRRRLENRYVLDAGLSLPITRAIQASLRASQAWNEANLPNYRYHNFNLTMGLSVNF